MTTKRSMCGRPFALPLHSLAAVTVMLIGVLLGAVSVTGRECQKKHVFPSGLLFYDYSVATIPKDCTTLNLRGSSIGDNIGASGGTAIAEALKDNTALTTLDLHMNSIKASGATAIAEALKDNTALTTLNLRWNSIGDSGATAMVEALKDNTALTTLDLSWNIIGDSGATALAEALKDNTALTTLDLSWNNRIGDSGATALAEALKDNTALITLDLSWNNINGAILNSITASLAETKTPLHEWVAREGKQAKEAQEAAARDVSIAAYHQSLLRNPCGSHPNCEEFVGEFVIAQIADLDSPTLFDLGITSAVDLLILFSAANNNPKDNVVEKGYSYVTSYAMVSPGFHALVEPLKPLKRRKLEKLLEEKGNDIPPTAIYTLEKDVSLAGLTIKEWAEKMHILQPAVAALEVFGADTVSDFALLTRDDLIDMAQTLLKTSTYLDAWRFEHGMAYTLDALAPSDDRHSEL